MATLYADTETYSPVPLTHGTHRYAQEAEIILVQWAIDDEPPQASEDILELPDPNEFDTVVFHNSHFDRHMLRRYGIELPMDRLEDTFVMALMHSLPGSLDKLSTIFKLPLDEAKSKEGKRLINLFCKPRPKRSKIERATPETHPQEWAEFRDDYGLLDIIAMRAVHKKLPRWNMIPEERALWDLDQQINDRGFQIDMDLVVAAIRVCAEEKRNLAQRTRDLTYDTVWSATQRDVLLAYIREIHGIVLPDLKAATIEKFLKVCDDPVLHELLEVREMAAMASVHKYRALVRSTSDDGRLRNTLQYCGAQRTGRWSGRVFQPHNLPRPTQSAAVVDVGIEAMKAGYSDMLTGNRMEMASNALRGTIVASRGKKLVAADYKNIESVALAWLAGEEWKLEAFRDHFDGHGLDIYTLTYCRLHGLADQEISKDRRQLGKVTELALGYEGGVGAFVTFATTYGIDLEKLTADALPRALKHEAQKAYQWMKQKKRSTYGLPEPIWVTCDTFKRAWRYAHPATTRLWSDLKDAFHSAIVGQQGRVYGVGRHLKVRRDGAWVRIILPSGRSLCYPAPAVTADGRLSYMGIHQWTKQWTRIHSYGGKLAENVTQAVARDILACGMLNVASTSAFDIVLSVHDELITEATPDGVYEGTPEELSALMTNVPWADGLPLAADGFAGDRYRKE